MPSLGRSLATKMMLISGAVALALAGAIGLLLLYRVRAEAGDTPVREVVLAGLIVVTSFAATGAIMGRSIARQIRALSRVAERISKGELDSSVGPRLRGDDELSTLAADMAQMCENLGDQFERVVHEVSNQNETSIAQSVQAGLIPPTGLATAAAIRVAGTILPGPRCGGDWWGHCDIGRGRTLLVVGDVTGHGVASVVVAAAARAACDVVKYMQLQDLEVDTVLELMNKAIYAGSERERMMTGFVAVIDSEARTITYANAGHCFPYVFRGEGDEGTFSSLATRGNRIGDAADSTYEAKTTALEAGDLLVFFTDGTIECENESRERFGEKRLRSVLRTADAEPDVALEQVLKELDRWRGGAPLTDDVTLILGRVV